jgi:hypothetical protein
VGTTPRACYHRSMRIGFSIVVVAASAAAAPRPGRIVRVEQALHRAAAIPRLCLVPTLDDAHAYCFGPEPEAGEPIDLIDHRHVLGRWRVKRAEPTGACKGSASLWQVESEPDGDIATDAAGQIAGVMDLPLDAQRAHLMMLDTSQDANGFGIDTDGDNHADIEFVLSKCDDQSPRAQCFDVWAADSQGRRLVDRQVFAEGCF